MSEPERVGPPLFMVDLTSHAVREWPPTFSADDLAELAHISNSLVRYEWWTVGVAA